MVLPVGVDCQLNIGKQGFEGVEVDGVCLSQNHFVGKDFFAVKLFIVAVLLFWVESLSCNHFIEKVRWKKVLDASRLTFGAKRRWDDIDIRAHMDEGFHTRRLHFINLR